MHEMTPEQITVNSYDNEVAKWNLINQKVAGYRNQGWLLLRWYDREVIKAGREVHHVMVCHWRFQHSGAGEPAPEYKQPHRTQVGGNTAYLINPHDPLLRDHFEKLFVFKFRDDFPGIYPHFVHIVTKRFRLDGFSELNRFPGIQGIARIGYRRAKSSVASSIWFNSNTEMRSLSRYISRLFSFISLYILQIHMPALPTPIILD